MNRGSILFALCLCLTIASCSTRDRSSLASPASPAPELATSLPRLDRDFVRYRAAVLGDGTEIWHTDYVYYYLVGRRDGRLRRAADGRPVAAGLLASQALAFMSAHHGLDPGTAWAWRVSRRLQYCRDGRVLNTGPAVIVDGVDVPDLWSLKEDEGGR